MCGVEYVCPIIRIRRFRGKAAYTTHEVSAREDGERGLALADGACSERHKTEETNCAAPYSMSIMWLCSPSTSIAWRESDKCGKEVCGGGSTGVANNGQLSSLAENHMIDFVCCSVILQKINLPNNTQRCE